MKKPIAVLAAGGSGGHIFPAQALAEELIKRGWHIYLFTDKRGKRFSSDNPAIKVKRVFAGSPSIGNIFQKMFSLILLGVGFVHAWARLKRIKPDCIIGFGGYPSVPTAVAAHYANIPVMLHEQNAVLGRANVFLAKYAQFIATAFPTVEHIKPTDQGKAVWTGNPIREAVAAMHDAPYPAFDLDSPFHIFVMGGSQGAHIFSDVVPAAIARLPENLQRRLHINQQCRPEDLEKTKEKYAALEASVTLKSFFKDVPGRMVQTHLMIARAGASTVAEVTAAGRPTIFVPLPTALDNDQLKNATAVEDAGGAWVMAQDGFTPDALASRLETICNTPDKLAAMAAKAKETGIPDAARRLADLVENKKKVSILKRSNNQEAA